VILGCWQFLNTSVVSYCVINILCYNNAMIIQLIHKCYIAFVNINGEDSAASFGKCSADIHMPVGMGF
jgi:hypothetical protein